MAGERPLPGARDVEDGRKGKRFTPTGKRADIAKKNAPTQPQTGEPDAASHVPENGAESGSSPQ